jgi:hypothetical protein
MAYPFFSLGRAPRRSTARDVRDLTQIIGRDGVSAIANGDCEATSSSHLLASDSYPLESERSLESSGCNNSFSTSDGEYFPKPGRQVNAKVEQR